MNRRNFIGALIAAPAIVRASSLMPVTRIWTPTGFGLSALEVADHAQDQRLVNAAYSSLFDGDQWTLEQRAAMRKRLGFQSVAEMNAPWLERERMFNMLYANSK